jgi:hypothetical protein
LLNELFLVGSADDELEKGVDGTGLIGSAVTAIPAEFLLGHAAAAVAFAAVLSAAAAFVAVSD